jgi:hypothetical protein
MHKLKLIEVDGEVGVVLPDEVLETMHLKEGSTIFAKLDAGGVLLTSSRPKPQEDKDRCE